MKLSLRFVLPMLCAFALPATALAAPTHHSGSTAHAKSASKKPASKAKGSQAKPGGSKASKS